MKGANSVHPQPPRFSPGHGRPPTSPSKKSRTTSAPPGKPTAMTQLQKLLRRLRKIKLRDPERMAWIRQKSRRLCNSWRFTVLTTALTIYALFGDDFRLCVTHKQTDELFNVLTMIACLVFGIEIFAQSLGQEEYFLGFFFMLDFGSTVTLILDLTWVSRELFCAGGEGEEALRTSRAGRAGARASRTVRIIRLMRLVKLYKAYWVAMEKKKEEEARKQKLLELKPGETIQEPTESRSEFQVRQDGEDSDDFEGEDAQREEDEPKQETRVGKKLSDMTTRRVIVLVLVMLVVLPQFEPSGNMFISTADFQESAKFAADLIYERWRSWCGGHNTTGQPWCFSALQTPTENQQDHYRNRFEMEAALLNFLHVHIQGSFFYRLYWVGATSRRWVDSTYLGQLSPLNQERFLGQDLWVNPDSLSVVWDGVYARTDFFQGDAVPSLPGVTKTRLINVWQEQCRSAVGIVVQPELRATTATGCSVDAELRCSEVQYITPLSFTSQESESFSFLFAFDQRGYTQLEAGLSILQTLFICFAVGVGAMTFSTDANELLLNPIERMIEKMETIKDNPLEAMRLGDLEFRREEVDEARFREKLEKMSRPWQLLYQYRRAKKHKEPMETVMLEKTIIKLGGLLALGFGEAGAEVIGQNMKVSATAGVNAMVPGSKVEAIIGFCNIRNFMAATEVRYASCLSFLFAVLVA
ncbi:cya [Symbiodinium natans]|uniref:Cya protein n=1 Tax=Symbiodinium natans TaxID=878477 RepID=A0A812KWF2_9DINO|nr:cya [Symbiodinium natans]